MLSGNNELPWEKIVSYHKEITRRSEEQFFSLFRKQEEPSDRWSFLPDEVVNTVCGPWEAGAADIDSPGLLRQLKVNDSREFFVGGPLWVQDRQLFGRNWLPHIHPFFLKEVTAVIVDDTVILEPLPGDWEISPLAFKSLGQSEMTAEADAEESLLRILREAVPQEEMGALQLSRKLRQEILKAHPVFTPLFQGGDRGKPGDRGEPGDRGKLRYRVGAWVLFTPGETGPLSRYLLNDYQDLESNAARGIIGGLKLLAGWDHEAPPDPGSHSVTPAIGGLQSFGKTGGQVLPIVPLNPYQESAVEGILTDRPVTVISGPPGCGKSQVVVSSILNAWSSGKTVLFASNNNQAVDVVKERLAPFEKNIPIAVRAGASAKNTLENDLQTTIAFLSRTAGSEPADSGRTEEQIEKLLEARTRLHRFLDSKLPEQIEQGVQAASKAYGEFLKTREKIEKKTRELEDLREKLGLDPAEPEKVRSLAGEAARWEKEALPYLKELGEQRRKIGELEALADRNREKFTEIMKETGIDTEEIRDWSWLLRNEGTEEHRKWLGEAVTFFESPIDTRLSEQPWEGEWDFWTSSDHCAVWIRKAELYMEEIQVRTAELAPLVEKLNELDEEYSGYNSRIMEQGFPKDWNGDREQVDSWNAAFALFLSGEKSFFSWVPFSTHSRAIRGMRKAEKELRKSIPLAVWRKIGKIDEESRGRLSEIMELLSSCLMVRGNWMEYSQKREKSEEAFTALRGKVAELGLGHIPGDLQIPGWNSFRDEIRGKKELARTAEEAWLLQEDRILAMKQVRILCEQFIALDTGFPLKSAWIEKSGRAFREALDAAGREPDEKSLKEIRTRLYRGDVHSFLDTWDKARSLLQENTDIAGQIASFPPEAHPAEQWYMLKPEMLPDTSRNARETPELPESGTSVFSWLRDMEKLRDDLELFHGTELPELTERLEQEFGWARQNIQKVFELIPPGAEKEKLEESFSSYLDDREGTWPVTALVKDLGKYNTNWIGRKIDGVNGKLKDLTFSKAMNTWLKRTGSDTLLVSSLQALLTHYRRNRKKILPDGIMNFRHTLKALPVWITTAQSPQSIPMIPEVFDLVIIDEATQCTLTNLLPLIFRGRRLVVIGDPEQLPAIPSISAWNERPLSMKFGISEHLENFGHDNNTVYSAAARCLPRRHGDILMLKEHYRSHPLIIGFSNLHIYQSMLKLRRNPKNPLSTHFPEGVSIIHVPGKASRGNGNRSWMNRDEAEAVVRCLGELCDNRETAEFSIGIVTPFRAQKDLINQLMDLSNMGKNITVGTAHAFQGDERDVMIFSPVAAPGMTPESVSWIEEPRNLINVAVTRARESMILVGNIDFLEKRNSILGKLAVYITKIEKLRESSREEADLYAWMVLHGWNPGVLEALGSDHASLILKRDGVTLAIQVGGTDQGYEERLAGYGCRTLLLEPRAINETPALVLKMIADKLDYEADYLLDILPDSMRGEGV